MVVRGTRWVYVQMVFWLVVHAAMQMAFCMCWTEQLTSELWLRLVAC